MAQTQTFQWSQEGCANISGDIPEVAEMPNDSSRCKKASYDQFLMVDEPEGGARG